MKCVTRRLEFNSGFSYEALPASSGWLAQPDSDSRGSSYINHQSLTRYLLQFDIVQCYPSIVNATFRSKSSFVSPLLIVFVSYIDVDGRNESILIRSNPQNLSWTLSSSMIMLAHFNRFNCRSLHVTQSRQLGYCVHLFCYLNPNGFNSSPRFASTIYFLIGNAVTTLLDVLKEFKAIANCVTVWSGWLVTSAEGDRLRSMLTCIASDRNSILTSLWRASERNPFGNLNKSSRNL